jgi:hypothetical protein
MSGSHHGMHAVVSVRIMTLALYIFNNPDIFDNACMQAEAANVFLCIPILTCFVPSLRS